MTDERPGQYPAHRAVHVGLLDGSTVHVRPVRAGDLDTVFDLFQRLSPESRALRFHGERRVSEEDVRRLVQVNYRDTFGLVAETARGGTPRVIALATYVRTGDDRAELAIVVDDPFRGIGVGSILIEHVLEAAQEAGIRTMEADVQASNQAMLEVMKASGLPIEKEWSSGVAHITFPASPTPEALEAFEWREAAASAAGVKTFLEPSSIAVIGASRERETIGGELFHNVVSSGFPGPVYPVNPKAEVVQSVKAYPSVSDCPDPVDLAVVAVPALAVPEVARECGRKGVKALVIISSGFAEVGREGAEVQRRVVEVARDFGMRIVGPNCMGVASFDESTPFDATFSPTHPQPGPLAFASQSGALGIAVMEATRMLGLGMSSFVSMGNKADISGNDLIQFWERDPHTRVILLYLESFGNPRKFARIARRIGRTKPVVAVKSGRSAAGARAAASHTGSLAAGDIAVEALFRQAGVVRTDTLEELFDVASLLAHQPLPAGPRVAILTNAGGLGILAADACESAGLDVVALSEETRQALGGFLPAEASRSNPVDMIASAGSEEYAKALHTLIEAEEVDSIITIFIPPLVTRAEDVAEALLSTARGSDKAVLTCFLGVHGIHDHLKGDDHLLPSFAFPESAARALAKVTAYGEWQARPEGVIPNLEGIDRRGAARLLGGFLDESGEGWLPPEEVSALLSFYGIPIARTLHAADLSQVRGAASDIGGPVAVKVDSPSIVHKSDVGGVALNLSGPDEAAEAAENMLARLGEAPSDIRGFVVQEMVRTEEGTEMFVGVTNDPLFGPLIACGAGGRLVELLRDVSVRITPLTDLDVHEMVSALKVAPVLEGYRGSPPLDREALEDTLLRISAMVEDLQGLAELDLNPLLVHPEGAVALDARARVMRPGPPSPRGARLTQPAP